MEQEKINASPGTEEASNCNVESIDQSHLKDNNSNHLIEDHLPSKESELAKIESEFAKVPDKSEEPLALGKSAIIVGIFKQMTANKWMEESKSKPIPQMLFGEFWFEGELCILFADTNLGKSILGVEIGDSITQGVPIGPFKLQAEPQTVLYFDFELSPKQFEKRYSEDYKNHYQFDDKFIRIEFNDDDHAGVSNSLISESVINSIELAIQKNNAKIIIIDNITWLVSKLIEIRDTSELMMKLGRLKRKYNVSMLVLAHTPKRNGANKIVTNDLGGSKMIANFADSIFAIGQSSKDDNMRYLKQLKQRNVELTYGEDNVCICTLEKPNNFLHFNFVNYDSESHHLKFEEKDRDKDIKHVLKLKADGRPNVEIAKEMGVSEGSIRKWLKKAKNDSGNMAEQPVK